MLPHLVQHLPHLEHAEGVGHVWTNIVLPGFCFFCKCLWESIYKQSCLDAHNSCGAWVHFCLCNFSDIFGMHACMLTWILRLSGCMDAVTFTSNVYNSFINRFVLKWLPYGYGENFFWRSFSASGGIRGSKTWGGGFSWVMVSLTLCFLVCFFIFHWILKSWFQ